MSAKMHIKVIDCALVTGKRFVIWRSNNPDERTTYRLSPGEKTWELESVSGTTNTPLNLSGAAGYYRNSNHRQYVRMLGPLPKVNWLLGETAFPAENTTEGNRDMNRQMSPDDAHPEIGKYSF